METLLKRPELYLAAPAPDAGAEHLWHGYPDECYSFTSFADSLVALAWGYGWYPQPPYVRLRNAMIVDFASQSEAEAEASIATGWNGAWEFPMGTVATVRERIEVNAQNARLTRHLTLIATGMPIDEFHHDVIEPLLDPHTCPHPSCGTCKRRGARRLEDVFVTLGDGTGQRAVQLFSAWRPSAKLLARADAAGIEIRQHPLDEIPGEDLEANRHYHLWDGTPLQAQQFRKTVWAPAWRRRG
jgi:hypothetical protein